MIIGICQWVTSFLLGFGFVLQMNIYIGVAENTRLTWQWSTNTIFHEWLMKDWLIDLFIHAFANFVWNSVGVPIAAVIICISVFWIMHVMALKKELIRIQLGSALHIGSLLGKNFVFLERKRWIFSSWIIRTVDDMITQGTILINVFFNLSLGDLYWWKIQIGKL